MVWSQDGYWWIHVQSGISRLSELVPYLCCHSQNSVLSTRHQILDRNADCQCRRKGKFCMRWWVYTSDSPQAFELYPDGCVNQPSDSQAVLAWKKTGWSVHVGKAQHSAQWDTFLVWCCPWFQPCNQAKWRQSRKLPHEHALSSVKCHSDTGLLLQIPLSSSV